MRPVLWVAVAGVVLLACGAGVVLALKAQGGSSDKAARTASGAAAGTTAAVAQAARTQAAKSHVAVVAGAGKQPSSQPGSPASGAAANEGQGESPQGESPGAASSATTASRGSGSPDGAIRGHLEDLEEGDYQGAFELMSARYRRENPEWVSRRSAGDPAIRIVAVGSPSYVSGAAYVYVDFYAQDAKKTPGSDTDCREFKGVVKLVGHSGKWRYDPYGDQLEGTLKPNSYCQGQ